MSNPRYEREGFAHVFPIGHRRTLERSRSASPPARAQSQGRTSARGRSQMPYRNPLCAQIWDPVERSSRGIRVWKRLDVLETSGGVDAPGNLAGTAPSDARCSGTPGRDRLVQGGGRLGLHAGRFWGAHTGPNPTDRAKRGCKRHLVTDANGIPLVVKVSAANVNDAIPALDLLDSIPPIQGLLGRPRFRPDIYQGDRAYGTPDVLSGVRDRGVKPLIPKINSKIHGSGLGKFRFVVERTLAWFGQNRRLKICYEKTGDHFQALHDLAAAFICANRLVSLKGVMH
jgi:transposase